MTSRPGQPALDMMRYHRTKNLCHAIKVIRSDGVTLLQTDHDRKFTFEGEVYAPISFGTMSADRREAAFRSGNQDVRGVIDGSVITIPDLDANRYRGAEVRLVVIDWRTPWVVYARHRKWIRRIVRDGSTFIGTMEGRAQALQRPTGGRFTGTFSTTCTYELGGSDCGKDISGDTKTGVTVGEVVESKRTCRFTTASWSGTFADEYYRDGSIVWTSGDNAGHVSAISAYTHDIGSGANRREVSFLFPTPKPVKVGDQGTAKPGCDGLLSTCKDKFSNQLNFGGDPFAPSASQLIEPVIE